MWAPFNKKQTFNFKESIWVEIDFPTKCFCCFFMIDWIAAQFTEIENAQVLLVDIEGQHCLLLMLLWWWLWLPTKLHQDVAFLISTKIFESLKHNEKITNIQNILVSTIHRRDRKYRWKHLFIRNRQNMQINKKKRNILLFILAIFMRTIYGLFICTVLHGICAIICFPPWCVHPNRSSYKNFIITFELCAACLLSFAISSGWYALLLWLQCMTFHQSFIRSEKKKLVDWLRFRWILNTEYSCA